MNFKTPVSVYNLLPFDIENVKEISYKDKYIDTVSDYLTTKDEMERAKQNGLPLNDSNAITENK